MALCRYFAAPGRPGDETWGWVADGRVFAVPHAEADACFFRPSERGLLSLAESVSRDSMDYETLIANGGILPPVDAGHEIWAAGVTYESSKFARMAESAEGGDFYAKVYVADRPELFFKATPSRCVGPGESVRIRQDSRWDVPEPELATLIAANGTILGYTIGNDMSSRDIEGANPLYLPQAKVYRGCCALGPVVVPAQQVDAQNLPVRLTITRDGQTAYDGETSTARMRRTVEELAGWLFRENDFPHGVMLLTGTGIIPPDDFTLQHGDEIAIEIEGIGVLRNPVA